MQAKKEDCCKAAVLLGRRKKLDFLDLGDSAGTNGTAALTDSETKSLLHSYWMDQLNCHLYVIARHAHLCTSR